MLEKNEEIILKIIACPSISWQVDAQQRLSLSFDDVEKIANNLVKKGYLVVKPIYKEESSSSEVESIKYIISYKGHLYLER